MILWIDDIRNPPTKDCYWAKSVNEAITFIIENSYRIDYLDLDHDAGDYAKDGGDYIKILDWMEKYGYNFDIHIHSMNPVGIQNMRNIIQHNNWREI